MKCHDFLHKHCQSCSLLALEYSETIKVKEAQLKELFPDEVDKIQESVICSDGAEGTRNKAKLAVAAILGEIQFGFYDQGIQFKKLENCPLHSESINNILPIIKTKLTEYKIIPYDINSKKGELKYILITYSKSSNELLIRFVLRSKESIDRLNKLAMELVSTNSVIKVVTANIQSIHQAILEGEEEIVLSSQEFITHQFDEYQLFQGARSFFQTNTDMAQNLYRQFQVELKKLKVHTLLDLYCGVGAFSFYASKSCSQVVGIEISDSAINLAKLAKEKNQCHHLEFYSLDTEAFLKQNKENFDVVLVNPPRRGLNQEIINMLNLLSSEYIFYSSCNIETLSRDWNSLKNNYQIKSLQLFDMFPYTTHFETLMILEKRI